MTKVIDASYRIGAQANDLVAAGIQSVFRYYTRDSVVDAEKRLHLDEARQLAKAGLRIGAIYEGRYGNQIDNFDRDTGLKDGTFARTYANHAIGQPAGSAIYFAVDTDEATVGKIDQLIIPYFESVAQVMGEPNGEPQYAIGVYGSGAVCSSLLGRGLVSKTWVAQATKWRGSEEFRSSKKWTLDQGPKAIIGGVRCDPDEAAPGADIGDFMLRTADLNQPALPTKLPPASHRGELTSDPSQIGQVAWYNDRVCIPELISVGAGEAGLAQARQMASRALPGYPHNGCAVHLCSLLELAGIDVRMEPYAGRAAHHLEQRGWKRVNVGDQQAGDVGVCIDAGPPEGADHVYLVVQTLADNEMMIADNQNGDRNAPHSRYATAGHGKTRTDYFLRAV